MNTITRSTGVYVAGSPYRPGGGYSGATNELDALVVRAAEFLAAEYKRGIEIRFNSDRHSGGAWLKNGKKGLDANCEVGLCVSLRKRMPAGKSCFDFSRAEYAALPDRLCINAYAAKAVLRDDTLATEGNLSSMHEGYAYVEHPTLEDALDWLRKNVKAPRAIGRAA